MALTLTTQPATVCPNPISRPIKWVILTTDHILAQGSFALGYIEVQLSGGVNGETITVMDQILTVDNTTPYTETTFKADGTIQNTAENLLNCMLSNYHFVDFQLYITTSGTYYRVNFASYEREFRTDWNFDFSGISATMVVSQVNGETVALKDFWLWYQVFDNQLLLNQVTQQLTARFAYDPTAPTTSGTATIDVMGPLARSLVSTTKPIISQTLPKQDLTFSKEIYIRYGGVERIDGVNVYGMTYKSANIKIVNSVFQLNEVSAFSPYCQTSTNPVKFLSNRPADMNLCTNTFEWIHIWIQKAGDFARWFRVYYTFYDSSGVALSNLQQLIQFEGAAVIGIGTANANIISVAPSMTSYYTIRIDGEVLDGGGPGYVWEQYSEELTRRVKTCNCKAAEVYFQEDKGSWRTMVFEKFSERLLEIETLQVNRRLSYATPVTTLYDEGGKYTETQATDNIFSVVSDRLDERNILTYEEFIRSENHWIRYRSAEGTQYLRRIVMEKSNGSTFRHGESGRLIFKFRFNAPTQF